MGFWMADPRAPFPTEARPGRCTQGCKCDYFGATDRLFKKAQIAWLTLRRRPASGSELSIYVPSQHAAPSDRGESIGCLYPVLRAVVLFAVSLFRYSLRPVELLVPLGGSDRGNYPADGDFYSRAFHGSVTLPAVGYSYGGN